MKRLIFCRATTDQRLNSVEGSTPSKTKKKKTAVKGGAGNVKAPAPTTGHKERDFIRVALVGEWSPQPGKNPQEETPSQKEKDDVACAALVKKER
jgi:hypothetical protein